jgi:hypothetical protein
MKEEIKSRLHSGNAFYHLVQSFVFPPPSETVKVKIYNIVIQILGISNKGNEVGYACGSHGG